MADNRMWLIHKPSKLGIMIGKRLGWGWDAYLEKNELQRFYAYLANEESDTGSGDDFILAQEDCSKSNCFDNWEYTDHKVDGFRIFEFVADPKSDGEKENKL